MEENEELKEKVEILFKLGRSYITKAESANTNSNESVSEQTTNPTQERQEPEPRIEEEMASNNLEDLGSWMMNKSRGFKRVSPSANSQPTSRPQTTSGSTSSPGTPGSVSSVPGATSRASLTVNERLERIARNNPTSNDTIPSNPTPEERRQYCHYFSNFGKCNYEARTGRKCQFEHRVAPMCQRGTACSRTKCMYTHPNMGGRNDSTFLGRNMTPYQSMMNPFMNPWGMMNPFQQQRGIPPFQ